MSQSLVAEDEDVRQSCFTKSAEEPGGHGEVCAGRLCPQDGRGSSPALPAWPVACPTTAGAAGRLAPRVETGLNTCVDRTKIGHPERSPAPYRPRPTLRTKP
jgi:hypothetical protein